MGNSIREIGENIKNSRFFEGSISFDESMAKHTTMKVGGNAALFIEPADTYSAATVFTCCKDKNIPVFTVGGGSNLVVSDEGFDGAVVSSRKMNRIDISVLEGDSQSLLAKVNDLLPQKLESAKLPGCKPCVVEVKCGAGTRMNDVAAFCAKYGIIGMEHFAGLPGTTGGAVFMNARCYDENISDVISSVEYIDLSGLYDEAAPKQITGCTYVKSDADWEYKHSPFQHMKAFITRVHFKCICLDNRVLDGYSAADPAIQEFIRGNNSHFVQDRIAKGHFRAPSAGSVFKNNHDFGKPSGQLIDEAGLKGTAVGGAQIAPWHGNFIINTGTATAKDIYDLVTLVQQKVRKETGFGLEPEIIFCGKGYENQK